MRASESEVERISLSGDGRYCDMIGGDDGAVGGVCSTTDLSALSGDGGWTHWRFFCVAAVITARSWSVS